MTRSLINCTQTQPFSASIQIPLLSHLDSMTNLSWFALDFLPFRAVHFSLWEAPWSRTHQISWTWQSLGHRLSQFDAHVYATYKCGGIQVLWGKVLSSGSWELMDKSFLLFLELTLLRCCVYSFSEGYPIGLSNYKHIAAATWYWLSLLTHLTILFLTPISWAFIIG